jgi:Fungal specific transcription factor domain
MDEMTRFAVIQHKVHQWKPNASIESDVALLGLIYQQAILLYLYTAASSTRHTKNEQYEGLIETAIVKAMGSIRELLPTARVNTNMCWPIAIIGSLATNSADQQEIRNRLETMNVTLGFGNILQVLAILEEMWQHPSDLAGPWNICIAMQKLQIWISFS